MPQITAVSIETAFQNGGIAFILLKVSLGAPYGDLASVAPVAQLMITGKILDRLTSGSYYVHGSFTSAGTPLWALLGIWKLWSKCIRPRLFPDENGKSKNEEQDLAAEQKPLQNIPSDLP